MQKKKVIIDCDNTMGMPRAEIDDGLTILYLLGREEIELLGITNCYANSSLDDVEKWTIRFLEGIGRRDIPRSSGQPYVNQNPSEWFKRYWLHKYSNERAPVQGETPAARFLVDTARAYPGEISLLALGSLGNLQEAYRIDPDFFSNLKEIALMGGLKEEFQLNGRTCHELNLACHPEAAITVFRAECPVVVMNAHICLQAPFYRKDLERVSFWPKNRLENIGEWIGVQAGSGSECFYLWDLLPAVYLSYPDLFQMEEFLLSLHPENLEMGLLKPDDKGAKILMPKKILDENRFMDILLSAWEKEWEMEGSGWK